MQEIYHSDSKKLSFVVERTLIIADIILWVIFVGKVQYLSFFKFVFGPDIVNQLSLLLKILQYSVVFYIFSFILSWFKKPFLLKLAIVSAFIGGLLTMPVGLLSIFATGSIYGRFKNKKTYDRKFILLFIFVLLLFVFYLFYGFTTNRNVLVRRKAEIAQEVLQKIDNPTIRQEIPTKDADFLLQNTSVYFTQALKGVTTYRPSDYITPLTKYINERSSDRQYSESEIAAYLLAYLKQFGLVKQ